MRQNKGKSGIRAGLLAFGALAIAAGATAPASAQEQKTYSFDVAAQPLGKAITRIAAQGGLQVLYNDDLPDTVVSPVVNGRMTVEQALTQALAGSGYTFQYVRPGVITLRAVSTGGNGNGDVVTGVVSVEGSQGSLYFGGAGQAAGVNGINGSRDITATEGTGSFTSGALTVGSKVPQALKDVPQSISVLTDERLKQQNVTDFTTALKELPGVSLVQGTSSLESTFYSRGFEITSIQVDGGAPLITSSSNIGPIGYFPQIDMAQYDHVELLRGADGTFNGYGDPSGSVNLVRKKPLDHPQFLAEAQMGSWSNYRLMADASSPLALDGRLRGRLVMTWQDNEHFYETAKDDKTLIYGIAEFDATPSTVVTAGVSYTKQNSVPWLDGLPRYQDGTAIKVSRSTCLCFDWNRWDFDTTEIFGGIEQKLGGEWTVKVNLTSNRQSSTQKAGYSLGAVNPLTDAGPLLTATYSDYSSRQFSAEATVAGSFEIFGQRQEITAGFNRVYSDGGGEVDYSTVITGSSSTPYQPYPGGPTYYSGSPNGTRPPIHVFDFDPNLAIYNEPRNPLPSSRYTTNGQTQYVGYVNLRLTAFDRLHLVTGLHWSRYEYDSGFVRLCTSIPATGTPSDTNCVGRQIGDAYNPYVRKFAGSDFSWPPSVSLSYDITKTLTAHVGYTDIYQSQAELLDTNLNPVDPVTGSNIEAGLKWQAPNGRLNISLAAYRIKQRGFATFDGTYDYDVSDEDAANGVYYYVVGSSGRKVPNGEVDADHSCCYASDPNKTALSEGLDIEVTGELAKGWQVATSYTFDRTEQEGATYGAGAGLPLLSIQPKHLYKLWTSFDFGAAGQIGWLSGLTLSGGINGQSSGFRSGTACVNLNPPNASGVSTCKSLSEPDTVPFSFVVPGYAVVSGRIDYRFSKIWSLAVNLDNIFDKTYYQSVGSYPFSGNWYGAPRSYTATLRAKW